MKIILRVCFFYQNITIKCQQPLSTALENESNNQLSNQNLQELAIAQNNNDYDQSLDKNHKGSNNILEEEEHNQTSIAAQSNQ